MECITGTRASSPAAIKAMHVSDCAPCCGRGRPRAPATARWRQRALPWLLVLILAFTVGGCRRKVPKAGDEFTRLTNTGKNYYDQGQADKAIASFESALKLRPDHPDAHLNLANA